MKKIFSIISLFAISVAVNAQLKVLSTGKVIVADTASTSAANLTVGPVQSVSGTVGITSATAGTAMYNTAIYGRATNLSNGVNSIQMNSRNYGIRGYAGESYTNYGVYGALATNSSGAGVYGTTNVGSPAINGRYAGYFSGDLHATGAITGGIANPYDITTTNALDLSGVLDDLCSISAKYYDSNAPVPYPYFRDGIGDDLLLTDHHYLLQLSTVATAFPNIVKTDGQGQQYVNYVEMIPILVKAIQELTEQVDALSEQSREGASAMAPSRNLATTPTAVSTATSVRARLYQNTPNPFTERTEIRFTLPDDARNAYIYIFDMQGKMLRQTPVDASMQSLTIDGYEFPAGLYLYSLVVNGQEIDTKRMILSK